MKSAHKGLSVIAIFAAGASVWAVYDTLRGKEGIEELFLVIPMLVASLVLAVGLFRRRQPGPAEASLPPPDPVALAQRNWRYVKLSLIFVTFLMGLTIATWSVRFGAILMPVLVGGVALAAMWTVMVIMFRPRRQKGR